MGFLMGNLQTCKLQLTALRVFKIPLWSSFLQKLVLNSSYNLPGRPTSVLEKDFLMDVLLHKKLKKAKN